MNENQTNEMVYCIDINIFFIENLTLCEAGSKLLN